MAWPEATPDVDEDLEYCVPDTRSEILPPLGQCIEDRAGEASSSPPCSRPCVLRNARARHAGVGPLKRR
ncbi:hypothetical protein GGQ01_002405 [Salinibacter ruber]|uniref:Uncharacterized protein n=1 Tax=Salinibacter ruber TaxID=146919 RepID=A0A9X2UMY7_9BACT|nr:hypothetical protein [Salinibacter ruber]